jgi:hypothetical protein
VGVNFFQQHRAKQAKEIEPPAVEPPPLPNEEEMKAIDTVKAIHVDDEQYALLTRALRPEIAPVRDDLKVDPPGPNVPAVVDRAGQPPAGTLRIVSGDQPPGTPIV